MSEFEKRLHQAQNGRGILFCGAGFTADCLNFNETDEIGTGVQLLTILNEKLKGLGVTHDFKDLKNAVDQYKDKTSEYDLMQLLCERFQLQSVSADIVDILKFPWERIYTTNYDNGIELGLRRAGVKPTPFNNLDSPSEMKAGTAIVHLHGYIEKWNIENFSKSCILGAVSFFRLGVVAQWLDAFRNDIERAEIVAFVGFNAADFHLNEFLYNISGLREKIFFINRSTSEPDPDVKMTQERFGQPLYIGRQGFAKSICLELATTKPTEPALASFRRYMPTTPSTSVPSVQDIEDMFIFGKIIPEHLARDEAKGLSDYHVNRLFIDSMIKTIDQGTRIVLLTGEICDGKTVMIEKLSNRLSATRPVYRLFHPYEDLLDEVAGILRAHPNTALIIENCFDINEARIGGIARMFHNSNGVLLLTCRNIAKEAEATKFSILEGFNDFREVRTPKLDDAEVNALVELSDQLASWQNSGARTTAEKRRFVVRNCERSLPRFLLQLLKSEYVSKKYREEYNKNADLGTNEKFAIIAALYIAHVGHDAPIELLSNALKFDVGAMLDRTGSNQNKLKLVHRQADFVRTVPAIGATNILEHMISANDIVDSVVTILKYLAQKSYKNDFDGHIFNQMMRYTILRSVVTDKAQIERFFDNTSKINYCRSHVLFWLQWHMAGVDFKDFNNAEKHLNQGYQEAANYEVRTGRVYDCRQLHDRKAKFLMLRAQHISRRPDELFRDLKEACEIVGRLLQLEPITHHPFQTLELIAETFVGQSLNLIGDLSDIARNTISSVCSFSEKKIDRVPEGYQRSMARKALDKYKILLTI